MKLILCRVCLTIIPATGEAMEFRRCPNPCSQSSIAYTGDDNEVAVSGPCTVLGLDDTNWEAMLRPDYKRVMPTLTTILKSASTVIDLDQEEAPAPPEGTTHTRTADGAYARLISTDVPVGAGDTTVRIYVDEREVTITKQLFELSYETL
jgi:hypothetical protein